MIVWYWWKSLGWGAILYLAGISGIDQELYEAAEVDGASRFRKIWHITVPGLMPTFFVLLLLAIGNFVNNGMEQYFAFQNAMNKDSIEVLDLYVYNIAFANNFPFATAVSMLKSIVSVILLFGANTLSKKVRGESII
ncbi:putative multiple-sugar transport system permease YteP [compost metagenome]